MSEVYTVRVVGNETLSQAQERAELEVTGGMPPWLPLVLSAFGGALLGSFITGSWPLPTDPVDVKYDKISKLIGSFVASGFVGFIAYELSRGGQTA